MVDVHARIRVGTAAVTVTAMLLVASACDPADSSVSEVSLTGEATTAGAPSLPSDTVSSDAGSTSSGPATSTGEVGAAAATPLCAADGTEVAGPVDNDELEEASGLVASRTHTGVYWTHDDGADATLYAVGRTGEDLGAHPLVLDGGVDAVDIEDIAQVDGPDGTDLLLADIGDNRRTRPTVRVYRMAEPDPSEPGPVADVEVLEFTYPDGPRNAETLLVDEASGTLVIVTKEQEDVDGEPDPLGAALPSTVYAAPIAPQADGPVELEPVGTIDVQALQERAVRSPPHPVAVFGVAAAPTGGDVSADGSQIAIRTYATVWLWQRGDGQTVAEALLGEPCEVAVVFERQGEAVAFDDEGLATIGEGANPPLHLIAR